jgi:thioredoxin-related protein
MRGSLMYRQWFSFVLFLTVGLSINSETSGQIYDPYDGAVIDEYVVVESYVVVQPEEVAWVTDYEQARELGEKKSLPVLLFITSDKCHYCEMMRRDVFTDTRVVNVLKQSYVAAKLNIDPDGELAEELKITMFPTTVIIDSQGNVLDYARGYRKNTEMHDRIVAAVSSVARVARK